MNILFSTVGRRGYLVKYLRSQLGPGDAIFGADNSPYAPGFAYCDHKALFPKVTESNYADTVLEYCVKHKIDVVIPLIDPELEALAIAKNRFDEKDIMIILSPMATIEIAFDKYLTYTFGMEHDIAVGQTFLTTEDALQAISEGQLAWPLVVKPRKGSASMDISYCANETQLCAAFNTCPNPMIQEFLKGDEYGYDLFGGSDYQPISVFCKKKLAMRSGETDKAVSTDDPQLIDFGQKILEQLPIFGPCDVDVIVTEQGPKLLEINPRFGGGYPCSHLAGADFLRKLIQLRKKEEILPDIGSCPANIVMMKQCEIVAQEWNDELEHL